MSDADASDDSGFPGGFVQNVLQHHSVLAPTRGCDHQSLSRLAQGERRPVVLHGELRPHDPIYVVAEGSWSWFARVLGCFVRAPFPQRGDVLIGQIHIIADIHGRGVPASSSLSVSKPTGHSANTAALQKTDLTPEG